ncbi:MAG: Gfo/Idh/MocA family oxidoreductase [Clostridia bacterium]
MIRWGFIGCGDVVEHKSGKPFWVDGQSEVVAVMCRNIDSAKVFAEKYNIADYYDDASKLIANPNVDAIYIATPPSTHMPYAKEVINAGKPVYVEKPMGMNGVECQEVVDLAREKGVPLFVAYYRRGLPYFQAVKKMIDDGEIGQVRSVNITHYTGKPRANEPYWRREADISGGGLFHDLGCHTLDVLDYIVGPIAEVYGMHANQRDLYDTEDIVIANFKFENGVYGTGNWCFEASDKKEQVDIVGNDGRIEFSVYSFNKLKVIKNGECKEIEIASPDFVQEPLIHNVISTLRGETTPLSTGETAVRTTRVIDAITK